MENKKQWIKNPLVVILLAMFATFLWGSAIPCIKIGYRLFEIKSSDTGGQMLFAGFRFFLAGIVVMISLSIQDRKICTPKNKEWIHITLLGFFQTFLQYFFYYIGMAHVTGVKGSIMNASSTLFCVVFAHFYYRNDKLSWNKLIGCIIGFSGVILINLTKGSLGSGFRVDGEGFLLLSAFVVAIATLISKEITQQINPVVTSGYQLAIGGLGLIILGYAMGGDIHSFSWKGGILFLYMIFISAVAFSIWSILLKYHPMGKISVYKFLIPVFGTLLSILILKESVWDIRVMLALVCVCIGIYFVNRERKTQNNKREINL